MLKFLSLLSPVLLCFSLQAGSPLTSTPIVATSPAYVVCNLPAPENLTLTGATTTSLDFAWSPVSGTDGYDILMLKVATGDPVYSDHIFTESITVPGLEPGELYEIRVSSVCPNTGELGGTASALGRTDYVIIDDVIVNNSNSQYVPFSNVPLFDNDHDVQPNFKFAAKSPYDEYTPFEIAKHIVYSHVDVFSHHAAVQHENGEEKEWSDWVFGDIDSIPFCPTPCSAHTGSLVEIWHKDKETEKYNMVLTLYIDRATVNGIPNGSFLTWSTVAPGYEIQIEFDETHGGGGGKGGGGTGEETEMGANRSATKISRSNVLEAYPIPFNDQLVLTTPMSEEEQGVVSLIEMVSGRVVYQSKWTGSKQHIVPGSSLPTGSYIVRLETASGVQTTKVIKISH